METKTIINRNEKYEEIYQELGNGENKIFENMRDVILFTAGLAIKKNLDIVEKPVKGNPIKIEMFSNYINYINLIALMHTMDISILTKDNEIKKFIIFESYADAGMKYIYENTINEKYMDLIVKLIEENREIESLASEKLDKLKF